MSVTSRMLSRAMAIRQVDLAPLVDARFYLDYVEDAPNASRAARPVKAMVRP